MFSKVKLSLSFKDLSRIAMPGNLNVQILTCFHLQINHHFQSNPFSIIGQLLLFSFAVVFNEPLSFLQRMVEYGDYVELIAEAAKTEDPVKRIEVSHCIISKSFFRLKGVIWRRSSVWIRDSSRLFCLEKV